ncbi:MAG: orotate phosphoribosyltransferase [Actinomycetota bacterium]|nr:orotate phosphoribosyltransferase [Actinomycetota bacterium]
MSDLIAELRSRGVYRTGHFRLSSGRHSDTYLQCALALQDPVFAAELGRSLAARLSAAGIGAETVASPAIGGLLAGFVVASAFGARFVFTERVDGVMALRRGQSVASGERVVVIEDVLTTGRSAQEAAAVLETRGAVVVGYGAIVDRSSREQQLPFAAHSLVRVEILTWEGSDCLLCSAGEPLQVPGSRGAGLATEGRRAGGAFSQGNGAAVERAEATATASVPESLKYRALYPTPSGD